MESAMELERLMIRRPGIILSLGIHAVLFGMAPGVVVATKVDQRPPIYLTLKVSDSLPQASRIHSLTPPILDRAKTPEGGATTQSIQSQAIAERRVPMGMNSPLQQMSPDDAYQGHLGAMAQSEGGTPAGSSPNPEETITIQPQYPLISRRLGEEGVVLVKINCPDASKCLYNIIQSSGHDRLDRSVRQSLSQLRLAQVDGRVLRFLFQLNH